MKLVCHSCGKRHPLADDHVAGKAAWHVEIGGKQVGPIDRDEVARRRREGELDEHSLVWREGLPEWAPLSTIAELGQSSARPPFTLDDLAAVTPLPMVNPYAREGSGLLEIRGIADTIASAGPRFVDELPGYLPPGLAHSMVMVPEVRSEPRSDRRIVFVLSTALALVTLLSTLLVVFVIHEDRDPTASPEPIAHAPRAVNASQPASEAPPRTIASTAPEREPHPEIVAPPPEPSTPEVREPVTQVSAAAPRARTRTIHRSTTETPVEVATAAERTELPAAGTPAPEPPAECTEVDCVVSGYADACCSRYRPAAPVTAPAPAATELPESLDRAALTKGIATIDVKACSGSSSSRGDVKVSIKISPEGSVTSVTIKSTPDEALGACVAAAAQKGVFAKTRRGGSVSYPWHF